MRIPRLAVVAAAFCLVTQLVTVQPGAAVVHPDGALQSWSERPEVVQIHAYQTSQDGRRRYSVSCTGTLIRTDVVLTAAHCLSAPDVTGFIVISGADATSAGDTHQVSSWVSHPEYDQATMTNDIGLLRLADRVAGVVPAALPPAGDHRLDAMRQNMLYGWGVDENGASPKSPQYARLDDYTQTASSQLRGFDPQKMIAAGRMHTDGTFAGGCSGDSGGPLLSRFATRTFIIGVVSFGALGCDQAAPTAFVRVSAYIDWINQNS